MRGPDLFVGRGIRGRIALTLALTAIAPVGGGIASHAQAPGQDGVERRQLHAPATIDGVDCDKTGRHFAEFHASGALRSCPLARDSTIAGHALLAGTWITLDTLGVLRAAWLSRDTRLAGHLCHGAGYKGFHVRFRADATLESCYLARDVVIDGVPCIHGSFWTEIRGGTRSAATFFPDGSLSGCQASRAFVAARGDARFRKWDRIARDAGGGLRRVD